MWNVVLKTLNIFCVFLLLCCNKNYFAFFQDMHERQ